MVKISQQKNIKLNNRDFEKLRPETFTGDCVDKKKSFAEFLGEVETYLSVLAPGPLARPGLPPSATWRS